MNEVDWENWNTGNFGHELLFCVIAWNLLESGARSLLAALLDANENTQLLFEDFSSGHLSNALKLAVGKCEDEAVASDALHFVAGFDRLQSSRNTIMHGLIGVYPHPDGKACLGKVLTQRVRAKHELIEATLEEDHLRKFVKDCQEFSKFLDSIVSELRPEDIRFALQEAMREMGFEELVGNSQQRPPLPAALQLNRCKIDKMTGMPIRSDGKS